MTRNTPADLAELGKLRTDLFKKYLWATSNTQLQNDLTAMAFKAMGKIVMSQQAPPYHPSVRYNAILVIGMLDSEYASESGGNVRPPKPHPTATKALTRIVEQSNSGKFPPPVILGALIGLERHAKYHQSLAPDTVKAMSTALLSFVNNETPIQGMDPDAYAWLRLRAASALTNLGSLGEKNEVHDALIKLIATSKSLDDRCSAAGLIGSFRNDKENKYDKVKVDAPATSAALFKLTGELSAEELKRAKDWEKNRGPGSYTPSVEFGQGDSEAQDDGYPRRHVLARLVSLGRGLSAVKPALPADSQKQVDALLAAIGPVIKAAADEKTVTSRVTHTIRTMNQDVIATIGEIGGTSDDEEEDDFTAGGPAPATAAAAGAPAAPTPATAKGPESPDALGTTPAPATVAPATPPPAAEAPPVAAPTDTPPPEGTKN
jgi:hypothetical protein